MRLTIETLNLREIKRHKSFVYLRQFFDQEFRMEFDPKELYAVVYSLMKEFKSDVEKKELEEKRREEIIQLSKELD